MAQTGRILSKIAIVFTESGFFLLLFSWKVVIMFVRITNTLQDNKKGRPLKRQNAREL